MKVNHRFRMLLTGGMLLAWTGLANAQEAVLDLSTPAQAYAHATMSLMLAANDSVVTAKNAPTVVQPAAQAEFEPSLFTGSNAHLTLGLATLATAIVTAAIPPSENKVPRERHGAHATLAKTTVGLAAATVATGLIYHWDDFHLEDGWTDPDNMHWMLGTAGTALMAYAVARSAASRDKVSHAGVAELGALGMAVAIKINW